MLAPLVAAAVATSASPTLALPQVAADRAADRTQSQRPNILVIVADDLGFADVGFNGGAVPTPNIDRIAKLGMVLDHFYVSSLCSPSRAGLLTGRYPHRFGIMGETITPGSDFGLDPQEETIADALAGAGYERRSFLGKWHLGHRSPEFHPMHFGFTSFYGHYNGAIDYFSHEREGEPDWHRNRRAANEDGYSTDLLTNEAVRIIDTPSRGGSPWFMWLAYNAPHGPLQATDADLDAVGFDAAAGRMNAGSDAAEGQQYGKRGHGNSPWQTTRAMIRGLDRGIGRILDELTRTGQLENTLILFTSDNGGPYSPRATGDARVADNGPLRGGKFQHYEGGLRVAAAIAWPARLKPRESANVGLVSYIDVLPTLAAIAGAPVRRPVDGEDVSAALISGRKLSEDRVLFLGEDYRTGTKNAHRGPTGSAMLQGRAAAVRAGKWKLIGDQLFDITDDPYERNDVAASNPGIVKALKEEVDRFTALRQVPRERMNAQRHAPIKNWQISTE